MTTIPLFLVLCCVEHFKHYCGFVQNYYSEMAEHWLLKVLVVWLWAVLKKGKVCKESNAHTDLAPSALFQASCYCCTQSSLCLVSAQIEVEVILHAMNIIVRLMRFLSCYKATLLSWIDRPSFHKHVPPTQKLSTHSCCLVVWWSKWTKACICC